MPVCEHAVVRRVADFPRCPLLGSFTYVSQPAPPQRCSALLHLLARKKGGDGIPYLSPLHTHLCNGSRSGEELSDRGASPIRCPGRIVRPDLFIPVAYLVWTIHSPAASASVFKMTPCRFSAAFTVLSWQSYSPAGFRAGVLKHGASGRPSLIHLPVYSCQSV